MRPSAPRAAPAARPTPPPPASPAPRRDAPLPAADGLPVAEDVYWRDYYLAIDLAYEWNNGRLEEKPVSDCETWQVYLWLLELVRHYLRANPVAQVVGLDMGFRLPLPTGTVIRRPDLGVVRDDNPVALRPLDVSYKGIFDLCVEAMSDQERRDIDRDLVVKKAEYAAAGVPEYFIVHRDPVYRDFVLPGLRDLEQQARDASARAEAEAQARAAAEARAAAAAASAEAEQQARYAAEARADAEAAARAAAEQELAALRARLAAR